MATEVPTPNSLPLPPPPTNPKQEDKRHLSIFDVPPDFFDSCRILQSPSSSVPIAELPFQNFSISCGDDEVEENDEQQQHNNGNKNSMQRWSCNTCKAEFNSLEDQRSHFKSDLHRFNIKLSIAGKDVVKEEDFDDPTCDSLSKDYDISSISGSEEEEDKESSLHNDMGLSGSVRRKIFVRLHSGDRVSIWKCLVLDDSEHIMFENDQFASMGNGGYSPQLTEREAVEKLKYLVHETRDNSYLRVVLLVRGGHFAGCVFDGNSVVAHKTFHRYVVRAKAGKKQSSKDASGKAAHSAGAALRRYNELALKKEIQELLATWKLYLDAASCIFIHAPSNNRQLLFDGEKPSFSYKHRAVRSVPLIVRRPTLKEAKRIYNVLTQVCYESDEGTTPAVKEVPLVNASIVSDGQLDSSKEDFRDNLKGSEITESCSNGGKSESLLLSSESEDDETGKTTSLHEAAKSGNVQKVLELLEDGMDPSIKDEMGKTPYMLAIEKEVRNTFRRFMASNPDKWDWNAAKVPSALTKEMEESQAAKQAVKDAKRKARSKELKKLRKAREKKAQAQEAQSQGVAKISSSGSGTASTILRKQYPTTGGAPISKEEELKRTQDAEREKRAAAAERRIAAAAASRVQGTEANTPAGSSPSQIAGADDICCSCCNASLGGKIPFHRYNYKYCSSSCMHVHKEILDDG